MEPVLIRHRDSSILGDAAPVLEKSKRPHIERFVTQVKQIVIAVALFVLWCSTILAVSWLSNRYAGQHVWSDVDKSGDDQFWCENDYSSMLIREPSNSWSDFSFLAVGLTILFVGISDMFLMNRNNNKSHNLFIEYPSLSIINALANIFHAFGTFSNHSCRCWTGYQMDVTGMYLVILFPLGYNLIHNYLHSYHHPNHLLLIQHNENKYKMNVNMAVTAMCALYLCAGFLFFLTTYTHVDPGLIVVPLVIGILVSTLKVRANSQKFQGKFHTSLFTTAVVCLGVGYVCWLLDRHRVVCFPHSVFQLHAVWHIATAISLLCIYLYQRSENHPTVKAVFDVSTYVHIVVEKQ